MAVSGRGSDGFVKVFVLVVGFRFVHVVANTEYHRYNSYIVQGPNGAYHISGLPGTATLYRKGAATGLPLIEVGVLQAFADQSYLASLRKRLHQYGGGNFILTSCLLMVRCKPGAGWIPLNDIPVDISVGCGTFRVAENLRGSRAVQLFRESLCSPLSTTGCMGFFTSRTIYSISPDKASRFWFNSQFSLPHYHATTPPLYHAPIGCIGVANFYICMHPIHILLIMLSAHH